MSPLTRVPLVGFPLVVFSHAGEACKPVACVLRLGFNSLIYKVSKIGRRLVSWHSSIILVLFSIKCLVRVV